MVRVIPWTSAVTSAGQKVAAGVGGSGGESTARMGLMRLLICVQAAVLAAVMMSIM